jgi:hypothetical protein
MNTKNPLKLIRKIHNTSTIYQKLARGIRDLGPIFSIVAVGTDMERKYVLIGAIVGYIGSFLLDLFTKENNETESN